MKVGFELLAELVNIESTTGGEAAYLRYLEELFVGLGWQVERQEVAENRWNLWVRRSPSPRITFCTHVDTVPPHIPATLRGDVLHGRGACDTKGVLLAMVEAVLGLPDEVQQQAPPRIPRRRPEQPRPPASEWWWSCRHRLDQGTRTPHPRERRMSRDRRRSRVQTSSRCRSLQSLGGGFRLRWNQGESIPGFYPSAGLHSALYQSERLRNARCHRKPETICMEATPSYSLRRSATELAWWTAPAKSYG